MTTITRRQKIAIGRVIKAWREFRKAIYELSEYTGMSVSVSGKYSSNNDMAPVREALVAELTKIDVEFNNKK